MPLSTLFRSPLSKTGPVWAVVALAGLTCGLSAVPAHAQFDLTGAAIALGPNSSIYTYIVRSAQNTISTGDYFTFYDIGSVTGVSSSIFTFTQTLSGTTPGGVTVTDSPNILNGTFTYTGPTSYFTDVSINFIGALASRNGTYAGINSGNSNSFNVITPVGVAAVTPSAVPEPGEWATLGILGAGLSGLMLRAKRRRTSVSTATA